MGGNLYGFMHDARWRDAVYPMYASVPLLSPRRCDGLSWRCHGQWRCAPFPCPWQILVTFLGPWNQPSGWSRENKLISKGYSAQSRLPLRLWRSQTNLRPKKCCEISLKFWKMGQLPLMPPSMQTPTSSRFWSTPTQNLKEFWMQEGMQTRIHYLPITAPCIFLNARAAQCVTGERLQNPFRAGASNWRRLLLLRMRLQVFSGLRSILTILPWSRGRRRPRRHGIPLTCKMRRRASEWHIRRTAAKRILSWMRRILSTTPCRWWDAGGRMQHQNLQKLHKLSVTSGHWHITRARHTVRKRTVAQKISTDSWLRGAGARYSNQDSERDGGLVRLCYSVWITMLYTMGTMEKHNGCDVSMNPMSSILSCFLCASQHTYIHTYIQ